MKSGSMKGSVFVLISGILNCLLSVVHQVVLYLSYPAMATVRNETTEQIVGDAILFSIATGFTLIFVGWLTILSYTGIKKKEKWAFRTGIGAAALLLSFSITIIVLMGFNQPIAYVHLTTASMIGIPLLIHRKSFS